MADLRTLLDLAGLCRRQWLPREELYRRRDCALRRLITHAERNFPYYRDLLRRAGLRAADIRSAADLQQLPPSRKEDLRRAMTSCAGIPSRAVWISTSGSSGQPMRFPFLPRDRSRLNLTWLRPLLAHGVSPLARTLEITGPHNVIEKKSWYQQAGLWRRKSISIFRPESEWLAELNREKPDLLWGYSGSLKLLARHVSERGKAVFQPKLLVGVSDLVDQECREALGKVFQAPLLDLYGAAEGACISWYCADCRSYHINADHMVLEFVENDDSAPGDNPRRILLTNLYSFAFPIIRYEIGDCGNPDDEQPRCGRGLPLMKIIAGRSDAMIRLPSGRLLSPLFFFAVMKKAVGILRWRIVQQEINLLEVMVQPATTSDFDPRLLSELLLESLKEPVDLVVRLVSEIPPPPGGKQCAVVSRINENK